MKIKGLLNNILQKSRQHGDFLNEMESAYKGDKKAQEKLDLRQLKAVEASGNSNIKKVVSDAYKKRTDSGYYNQPDVSTPVSNKPTLLTKMLNNAGNLFKRPAVAGSFGGPPVVKPINFSPTFNTTTSRMSLPSQQTMVPQNNYQIRSGDSLSVIASRNNMSIKDLLRYNPQITNPNQIQVGQNINLGTVNAPNSGVSPNSNEPAKTVDQIFAELGKADPLFVGPMPYKP